MWLHSLWVSFCCLGVCLGGGNISRLWRETASLRLRRIRNSNCVYSAEGLPDYGYEGANFESWTRVEGYTKSYSEAPWGNGTFGEHRLRRGRIDRGACRNDGTEACRQT